MSNVLQRLQYKANGIFVLIALFGIFLALYVVQHASNVAATANQLTEQHLPALAQSQRIAVLLTEQERILYEYYATADTALYDDEYAVLCAELQQQLLSLLSFSFAKSHKPLLNQQLENISKVSKLFHQNMQGKPIDWDLARDHLQQLSDFRRAMLPDLNALDNEVNILVQAGYQQTKRQLRWVSGSVMAFSLGIVALMLLLARHVRRYILLGLQLRYKAYHFEPSGLLNRQKLTEDIQRNVDRSERFSIILIELSQYSRLEVDYGLTATTDIVNSAAAYLKQGLRHGDVALINDEQLYQIADAGFAVLVPIASDADDFTVLLQQISSVFSSPLQTPHGAILMPVQMGITEYPRCSKMPNDVLLHARIALDAALKQQQQYLFFDHILGNIQQRHKSLNTALQLAVEQQQLELYFQPQCTIDQQRLTGVEVLIRWQLDGQFISPAEFIPLAEQSGLILPLGRWILQQACIKAVSWQQQGLPPLAIAVNISPRQFMQPDFVAEVAAILAETGLAPERLELEITEGIIMQNEVAGLKVLKSLKALGVKLAVDDFGTGYSSLAYLKHFPVDKLKIDQSFIRQLHDNKEDQAIVLSLCQLGNNLGLTVIAEGVERAEQRQQLEQFHCAEIQGYWYSKPLPESALLAFMQQANR